MYLEKYKECGYLCLNCWFIILLGSCDQFVLLYYQADVTSIEVPVGCTG